jgi:selenide,water dikinase
MIEEERTISDAARWMTTLNSLPATLEADILEYVHSCTDVTGFGLAGHALDMLSSGGLDLVIGLHDLPLIHGVLDLACSGLIPAGTYNNRIEYERRVRDPQKHEDTLMDMIFDAQTSGGLLMALPEDKAILALDRIRGLGFESAAIIGRFKRGKGELEIVDNI